jgi:hypothetical protein
VVQQPEMVLQQIRQVLKPAGRLVIPTYCHGENLRSRFVSHFMRLFGFKSYSRFTVNSLVNLLRENGFQIKEKQIIDGYPPLAVLTAMTIDL